MLPSWTPYPPPLPPSLTLIGTMCTFLKHEGQESCRVPLTPFWTPPHNLGLAYLLKTLLHLRALFLNQKKGLICSFLFGWIWSTAKHYICVFVGFYDPFMILHKWYFHWYLCILCLIFFPYLLYPCWGMNLHIFAWYQYFCSFCLLLLRHVASSKNQCDPEHKL